MICLMSNCGWELPPVEFGTYQGCSMAVLYVESTETCHQHCENEVIIMERWGS